MDINRAVNNMSPLKRRRRPLGVFVFVFIALTLSNTLMAILPSTANAAPESQLGQQISTTLYQNALLVCAREAPLSGGGGFDQNKRISESEALQFNLFGGNGTNNLDISAGYMLKKYGSKTVSTSGFVACSSGTFIKEALQNLGYTKEELSGIDNVNKVLCDLGFRRASAPSASTSAANCYKSSGDWRRGEVNNNSDSAETKQKLHDTFKSQTDSGVKKLSDAAKYVLFSTTVKDLCKVGPGETVNSSVDKDLGAVIKETTDGRDEKDVFYRWGENRLSYAASAVGIGEGYAAGFIDKYYKIDPAFVAGIVVPGSGLNVDGGVRNNTVALSNPEFYGAWLVAEENPCAKMAAEANKYFTAFQRFLVQNPDEEANLGTELTDPTEPGATTCAIEGAGWIVCPVVNLVSKMSDALYGWITSYLKVQPLNVDTGSHENTTYIAWNIMRNLANAVFVIVFIIIIYSQLTGMGVTNYGVKKALPRLIVAAILVNLSFWISAIAIDLSNIIGNNLYNVLKGLPLGEITVESLGWEALATWLLSLGAVGAAVMVAIPVLNTVGIGGAAMLAVYALIPIVIAVVIALVITFVVLALRQALIIIMVVVSPLAFVAMLLPNTEKYFKMWQKSFLTLLIFYPLFSLLFGGAAIAGTIIIGSAGQGEPSAVVVTVLIGMAVSTLPLFLTPMLIKFSSGLMGTTASMLNGKLKNNALSRTMKGLRNRKASLAMGESLGRESRNPFNRAYRAIQNNRLADTQRKANIDSSNKANYLETARAGRLETQSGELSERIKAAEGEQHERHEEHVRNSAQLMQYRQRQGNATLGAEENKARADLSVRRAQDADPALRNARLRGEAAKKQMAARDARFQQTVTEAGSLKGGADLIAQGYDQGAVSQIQDAQTQSNIISSATTSAQNVQQQEYAKTLGDDVLQVRTPTGAVVSIQEAAGGIDPYGKSRVVAAAANLEAETVNKAISIEKSTMTKTNPGVSPSNPAFNPAADTLHATYVRPTESIERRAAALGKVVTSGTDDDIMDAFGYISSLPDSPEKALLQQQFAADVGARKPISLGAGVMAQLGRGTFTGDFESSTVARLDDGKLAPESLYGASADELKRIVATVTGKGLSATKPNVAELKASITRYKASPNFREPTPEIANLINQIEQEL